MTPETVGGWFASIITKFAWTNGALGAGIVGIGIVLVTHFAWIAGGIPGVPGYVTTDEFAIAQKATTDHLVDIKRAIHSNQSSIESARRGELRAQMRQDWRRVCQARSQGLQEDEWLDAVDDAQEQYESINDGVPYNLDRDCAAVPE